MTVLRRLDAVLRPTKQAGLDVKITLDDAGIVNQEQPLRHVAGQAFYNTSAGLKQDQDKTVPTHVKPEPIRLHRFRAGSEMQPVNS